VLSFPTLGNKNIIGNIVLVRVDLNVPLHDGQVTDLTRILAIKDTVDYLLQYQAKVLLLSHFGRPKPNHDPAQWDLSYSLKPLVVPLEQALNIEVQFVEHYAGPKVSEAIKSNPDKRVFLLENIRFAPGEESNSHDLAKELAQGADLYVNEAFSCSHRAHASIEAIVHQLPSSAGLHFTKEVQYLEKCLTNPQRPLVAIVGGAKVSTKITLLENLCNKVDSLIIGGAMANTFLAAQGKNVGSSLYEPDWLPIAAKVFQTSKAEIILPVDAIVASDIADANGTIVNISDMGLFVDKKILDIGPRSLEAIKTCLQTAKTIVWNGPVGAFEYTAFANGTMAIARLLIELTKQGTLTVAGGGDTVAALNAAQAKEQLSYVSTAGGAFLEWIESKQLPGVEALTRIP
jgi:phosphoglycerate kinase